MDNKFEIEFNRLLVEGKEEWTSWVDKMPALHFDPTWGVQIIPPFGGALARFRISKGNTWVSVYFDAFNRLGYFGSVFDDPVPYFELYPFGDDVKRYGLDEVDELMSDIRKIFNG